MDKYPSSFFISSGVGTSAYELVAFDNALLSAGISNYNLLKVSSILPCLCERKDRVDLKEGSPLLTAYAALSSDEKGTLLATAVAAGIPKDRSKIGVIMEYKAVGISAEEAESRVRSMVEEAMRNHGIELEEIVASSAAGVVETGYLSLISAVVLW